MSMVIANNMQAINTKRQFATSARGMSGAMEKLSSGYKINTGKDDPAGLVVSEKLRSQINGLKRAQQNTEEAINVMGIAEGALNEMNNILKKMKALAIHSNNTGVTSPEQIAADQAEMDSAIQTLDRIAQNTKFSNENLLNGAKDLDFTVKTSVQGTQNNALVNGRESEFTQIFKRDGYAVSVNFTGTQAADELTALGEVDFTQQAMKAYMEVDTSNDPSNTAQVENGKFTQKQSFTLTGSRGSRAFTVKKGETVATLVNQIKSASGQTGIDAALVFNSDQKIDMTTTGTAQEGEYNTAQFKIPGMVDSDGKEILFTLEPTEEMQAILDSTPGGLDFGISVDNTGIALTVNGNAVTTAWDGSAQYLRQSLQANGSAL
ncbi:MAG: flagellin, partial [Planctomycetaceae bacterium]|nr:flagellin [Planctomycetaceae bacterium]